MKFINSKKATDKNGAEKIRTDLLRGAMLHAKIDVSDSSRFSVSGTQAILDNLLKEGYIDLREYLERLPDGLVPDKYGLLSAREKRSAKEMENA